MPKVTFSNELKKNDTNYNFPKMKLDQGEKARIVCLGDPHFEYQHRLQAPIVDDAGVPVMTTDRDRNGREFPVNEMQFKSTPLCLGEPDVLDDKGSDPKNCPMCEMARSHPDWVKPPVRRWAMNIIKYKTKANNFDLVSPFSVEAEVWSFTDRIFNKLVDFQNEHGDLKKKDLLLGPCENKMYQKFDIASSSKAEWLSSDDNKARTRETFREQALEDLSIACGSRKPKNFVVQDLEDIEFAWGKVAQYNGDADVPDVETKGSLSDGLADIFSTTTSDKGVQQNNFPDTVSEGGADEVASAPVTEEKPDEAADLLSGLTEDAAPKPVEKKDDEADPYNFDDLLKSV
jgi:hypothetical protein